jgi:hypothetical protein
VCRKNGAADVKLVYADLTDPKETKKLGEVRMSSCSSGSSSLIAHVQHHSQRRHHMPCIAFSFPRNSSSRIDLALAEMLQHAPHQLVSTRIISSPQKREQ